MLKYFRSIGLALLLSVGIGSVISAESHSSTSAKIVSAKQVVINPELTSFRFGFLNSIPKSSHPETSNQCPQFTILKQDQQFMVSGDIGEKGWRVLAEVQLAQYKLIAFAGKFEPGSSGTCAISESNIAIFENDKLLGVIYLESSKETLIGHLELMDAGFVRVYSGRFIWELVAELHLGPEGLALTTPISEFTAHCNGKAIVPNTLGENIADGREVMFEFGFTPIPFEQMPGSWTNEYFPGINELVGCSNGITFCGFRYENEHSRVWLTTIGDTEIVRNEVSCKK